MNSFQPQFYGSGLWSADGRLYSRWSTGNNGYCAYPPTEFVPYGPDESLCYSLYGNCPVLQTPEYNPPIAGTLSKKACLREAGNLKNAGINKNLNCEISVKKVTFSVPVSDSAYQRDGCNKVKLKPGYQNRSNQLNPKPKHLANSTKDAPVSPPKQLRVCGFCRQNGERREFFLDHLLKDEDGNVACPVLMQYICPICGATGKKAHTKSYCPLRINKPEPLAIKLKRTSRDSCGRFRNRK